eukprot:EG_transcript_16353
MAVDQHASLRPDLFSASLTTLHNAGPAPPQSPPLLRPKTATLIPGGPSLHPPSPSSNRKFSGPPSVPGGGCDPPPFVSEGVGLNPLSSRPHASMPSPSLTSSP